jgi:thioester reductase-like protein
MHGYKIAALVREGSLGASERLELLYRKIQSESPKPLPQPQCLAGDVTKPMFGLSYRDTEWLRKNCSHIVHNAASVQFEGGVARETLAANLRGAEFAAETMNKCKIEHMSYVSTAYVCGRCSKPRSEEEQYVEQLFRNEYEKSKYESERIMRACIAPSQLTIFRPAIIVGDSKTGYSQQFHSIYRFAQFTSLLADAADKRKDGSWQLDVRLKADESKTLNLVTVDWVSAAIVEILSRVKTSTTASVFHLTPSHPTKLSEIEFALSQCFRYKGVQFVGADSELTNMSLDEQRFYEYVSSYLSYWNEDPVFLRSNTDDALKDFPEPRVDANCLMRLFQFAIDHGYGRSASTPWIDRNRNRKKMAVL